MNEECAICFNDIGVGNISFHRDMCKSCVEAGVWDEDEEGNLIHPVSRTRITCICGKIWNKDCFRAAYLDGYQMSPAFYEALNQCATAAERRALVQDPAMYLPKEHGRAL